MIYLENIKENMNSSIIKKYNLLHKNNHFMYDSDMEELFNDNGIKIVAVVNKCRNWDYGEDCNLINCQDGDYLETLILEQGDEHFECQAFAEENSGCLDYTLAILNIIKTDVGI